MGSAIRGTTVSTVRADALFVSALQRRERPGAAQVQQAVAAAVRAFGPAGCAARVAQEFGDHPETAVTRMRWARELAAETFGEAGRAGGEHEPPGRAIIPATA